MITVLPWERAHGKVCDRHLQRLAVVYVRQSTQQQVVHHQESTQLQYALVERAVALGWTADRVLVIDDDLGMSATTATARTGFNDWLPRSAWTMSGWCWASRCPAWLARARTGTS
ncbi:hypothetical protein [Nonomuraea rubra]|uniref:hypothetical protein n=1 Tax=Nonomuraea rubra TaxID=46180 RepID=UPI0036D231D7